MGVWRSDEMKCYVWLHQPQKVTSTLKSHINPKKSKKSKKVKKSSTNFFFFFFGPFCYKNVEKMFHQPQKVTLSPQKVKKVQKFFLLFFTYCVRKKSHLYIYFLNFGPLPHLKNPYYENVKFFKKKISYQINPKICEFISILWGN